MGPYTLLLTGETHRSELAFARGLPRNDVPLLRGRHDDLRLRDLFLRELHITYAVVCERAPSPTWESVPVSSRTRI